MEAEWLNRLANYDRKECFYLTRNLNNEYPSILDLDDEWFRHNPHRQVLLRRPFSVEFEALAQHPHIDQFVRVDRCDYHRGHRTHFIITGKIELSRIETDAQAEAAMVLVALSPGEAWANTPRATFH